MKEFDLTDEQIEEIKKINSRMNYLNDLLKSENNETLAKVILEKLLDEKVVYDLWFAKIEASLPIKTTPDNKMSVDFNRKKIQFI